MINNRTIASAAYGTHLAPLIAAVLATNGDIVEFGMGDFSTPVLHEIIRYQNRIGIHCRNLISYEENEDWIKNFEDLRCDFHTLQLVENWNMVEIDLPSVIFIDHAPASRRIIDIEKYADSAEIIVVHDTDKKTYYNYDKVFPKFRYQTTYMRYKKSTTLLSNIIDITKLI